MPGRQAGLIVPSVLRQVLAHIRHSTFPERDRVIVLLSVRAGLRAAEIAQLDWSMVLDVRGQISDTITIRDAIAKKGSGRRVPMHQELRHALHTLKGQSEPSGPIVRSVRGGAMRPNSIVNWFVAVRGARDPGLFLALRSADLYHRGGTQCPSCRLQLA